MILSRQNGFTKMTEALITPEIIKWAIDRNNDTPSGLAMKMNVKPTTIAAWKSGDEKPSIHKAQELAKKLRIPFGYLYLKSPPIEILPLPDLRVVSGAPPKKPSPNFLDVLYDALRKQEWYHKYLKDEGVNPLAFVGRFKLTDNQKSIAKDIQNTLGINNELRIQSKSWEEFLTLLSRQAEGAGILVLRSGIVGNDTHRKLDTQEFRGFAISDELAPLVFINGGDYKAAQIFTLAHELAHLWVAQSGVSNPDYSLRANQQKNTVDQLCDHVAAEVLVPSDDFEIRWNSFDSTNDNLEHLASHYRVSAFVILRRAYELDKINVDIFRDKYEELLTKTKKKLSSDGGDFHKLLMSRNSSTFTTTLLVNVAEGKVSPTEAAKLLNLRVASLGRLINA